MLRIFSPGVTDVRAHPCCISVYRRGTLLRSRPDTPVVLDSSNVGTFLALHLIRKEVQYIQITHNDIKMQFYVNHFNLIQLNGSHSSNPTY